MSLFAGRENITEAKQARKTTSHFFAPLKDLRGVSLMSHHGAITSSNQWHCPEQTAARGGSATGATEEPLNFILLSRKNQEAAAHTHTHRQTKPKRSYSGSIQVTSTITDDCYELARKVEAYHSRKRPLTFGNVCFFFPVRCDGSSIVWKTTRKLLQSSNVSMRRNHVRVKIASNIQDLL